MAHALTIRVNVENGSLVMDRALSLGSTYAVTFEGLEGGSGAADVLLTDYTGQTLAASLEGELSLATQALQDAFAGVYGCPTAKVLRAFVYSDSAVVATADVLIRWSPYAFTPGGLPITLQGEPGEPGMSAYESWLAIPGNGGKSEAAFVAWLKGEPGERGETGENGAYVPMAEMYAFSVDAVSGRLIVRAQDADKLFAVDAVGEPDYTRPLFVITEAGHIAYQFWDNGRVSQTVDLGNVTGRKGDTGAAWTFEQFTPEQLAALKGADGADGLTEQQVRDVVVGYNYATAAALALMATKTELTALESALRAALTAGLGLKQDTLVWDAVPTAGSAAAMSSGALKTQFDGVASAIAAAAGVEAAAVQAIVHQMFTGLATSRPRTMFQIADRVQQICKILTGEV